MYKYLELLAAILFLALTIRHIVKEDYLMVAIDLVIAIICSYLSYSGWKRERKISNEEK